MKQALVGKAAGCLVSLDVLLCRCETGKVGGQFDFAELRAGAGEAAARLFQRSNGFGLCCRPFMSAAQADARNIRAGPGKLDRGISDSLAFTGGRESGLWKEQEHGKTEAAEPLAGV